MDHGIWKLSSQEVNRDIALQKNNHRIFVAELNGRDIRNIKDYFEKMSEVFRFPIRSNGFDGYEDWMRDLDWLNKDGYVVIIYNYHDFLSDDLRNKQIVLDSFKDTIIPWWQKEVEQYEVGGKAKPFHVYLID